MSDDDYEIVQSPQPPDAHATASDLDEWVEFASQHSDPKLAEALLNAAGLLRNLHRQVELAELATHANQLAYNRVQKTLSEAGYNVGDDGKLWAPPWLESAHGLAVRLHLKTLDHLTRVLKAIPASTPEDIQELRDALDEAQTHVDDVTP